MLRSWLPDAVFRIGTVSLMKSSSDDWRVTVTFADESDAHWLAKGLEERELPSSLSDRLGERITVSPAGVRLFVYAGEAASAQAAESYLRELVQERDVAAEIAFDRWHPLEERWEPADLPLPQTDAERSAEREKVEQEETELSQSSGLAAWEVRIALPRHREAVELAERLQAEGLPIARSFNYVFVGANDEDEARALSERLAPSLPADATASVEPGPGLVYEVSGRRGPFLSI